MPVIERVSDWTALQGVWNGLVERSRAASPFLTWEWLSAWWQAFGRGSELLVLVSRPEPGSEPAAIAPLMISREGGIRTVRFIGWGMSDSLDFIVGGDDRESVPAFFRFLCNCPAKWALLWLGDFIADEETIGSVERAAFEAGLKGRRLTPTRAPFLAVSGTWDAFLAGKSRHFRHILKQKESRISRCDRRVSVERIRGPLGQGALSDLRAVEAGSWKGREFARSAEKKKEKEFLERALPALASRGWLDLWMARVDGRPAAYQIDLDFGGTSWVYNNAFDRSSAELSLGAALMKRAVEAAFREGKRECNFLRGEEAFKKAWTETAKDVFQLLLRRPGIPSRLACAWAAGLVRNARRLQSRYGKPA